MPNTGSERIQNIQAAIYIYKFWKFYMLHGFDIKWHTQLSLNAKLEHLKMQVFLGLVNRLLAEYHHQDCVLV